MEQELTYRYRIYPDPKQEKEILRTAEVARQYYNKILAEKTTEYLRSGIWKQKLNILETIEDYARQRRVESSILQHAAQEAQQAFRHFRWIYRTKADRYKENAMLRAELFPKYPLTEVDLKGYPGERQWGAARKGYTLSPALLFWQDRAVMIPGVGWVRARFHRLPPEDAQMKSCTVLSKSTGKYYLLIRFLFNVEDRRPERVPEEALGIVFYPGRLAVRSDGVPVSVRHTDPELQEQIQRSYRTLCRRKPGSKRYAQQRKKLARLCEKQAARRRDALHKASRQIADTGKMIGIQVPAVKKRAQRHKKKGLERVVHDEAWYSFFTMLRYKANMTGMPVYPIPLAYPAWKICSACGAEILAPLRTKAWICPKCGILCGKAGNAARNVQHYMDNEIQKWKALPPKGG